MNKKSIFAWMLLYTLISFFGFFVSLFFLMTYGTQIGDLSLVPAVLKWQHYMIYGLPIVFFLTPFIAWVFYKKKEFKSCLITAPGFPVAYIIVILILNHAH